MEAVRISDMEVTGCCYDYSSVWYSIKQTVTLNFYFHILCSDFYGPDTL